MPSFKPAVFLALTFTLTAPLAAQAAPATPAPPGPELKAEQAKNEPDIKEKLICTRETPVGSTIPKRVCRTKSQIEKERDVSRKMRDDIRSGNSEIRPR